MPELHGIDVSHNNLLNQGPIDWSAVATTTPALRFVMARMTHGGHGDDDLRVDRQALNNRDGMRAAFPATARGYYHFLGTGSPEVQARHFRSTVGDLQPGEFIMLDVEEDAPAKVPGDLPVEHIVATLEAMEQACGLTPWVYIGRFYPGSLDQRLFRFPLVLPAFTSEQKAMALAGQMGRAPIIWQWGGDGNGATVAGISGRVDSNRIEDMDRFHAGLFQADSDPVDRAANTDGTLTGPLQFMPTLAVGRRRQRRRGAAEPAHRARPVPGPRRQPRRQVRGRHRRPRPPPPGDASAAGDRRRRHGDVDRTRPARPRAGLTPAATLLSGGASAARLAPGTSCCS